MARCPDRARPGRTAEEAMKEATYSVAFDNRIRRNTLADIAGWKDWLEILRGPKPSDGSDRGSWNGQPNPHARQLHAIGKIVHRLANWQQPDRRASKARAVRPARPGDAAAFAGRGDFREFDVTPRPDPFHATERGTEGQMSVNAALMHEARELTTGANVHKSAGPSPCTEPWLTIRPGRQETATEMDATGRVPCPGRAESEGRQMRAALEYRTTDLRTTSSASTAGLRSRERTAETSR